MNAVSSVNPSASEHAGRSGAFTSEEDQTQAFLQLLVIQMQNQDPLDPMKNEDFLAQLAQFQSLEQQIALTKQNSTIILSTTLSSANSLIGRTVKVLGAEDEITGVVKSVVVRDGVARIVLDEEEYGLGDIISVMSQAS